MLARAAFRIGHEGQALSEARRGLAMRSDDARDPRDPRGKSRLIADFRYIEAYLTGDYAGAWAALERLRNDFGDAPALVHDPAAAGRLALEEERTASLTGARIRLRAAEAVGDWPAAAAALADYDREQAAWMAGPQRPDGPPRAESAVLRDQAVSQETWVVAPLRALVLAHTGKIAEALALAAGLPGDCVPCLRARAGVAEVAGDRAGADKAFAAALALAPDVAITETAWGQILLARGDVAGALVKLASASRKGPRSPDALELWGEALMAKGDFGSAVSKFHQAAVFAPAWGRLHLKWAEALARAGKAAEARAQKQAAAGLDMTPAERTELNGLRV
jgi:tetratricopeptide (TPR) repeat protein